MPTTTATDGSTVVYESHGEGPPLLLIPGLGFGPWAWFKQVPALSRRFRVLTFDLRSPRDPEHGVAELARDAAVLLERSGVGRAHVLGTSLGGFVAQELALRRPDLVDGLVLVSTSYGGRGDARMSPRTLAAMFGVGSFSPRGAARKGLKAATSGAYRSRFPGEFEEIVSTRLARSPSPFSYLQQARAGAAFDASPRVRNISAPTLVIHGAEDRYVPVANAVALARAIPNAKLRILDDAGHLVFIERAEEFNEEVASFLLGYEEPAASGDRGRSAQGGTLPGWVRSLRRVPGRVARKLRDRLSG
ncbi:alpha/beta fold hydrolase [Rubrobacter marinus]|uniref:Alpha/beta fold hydrolase n=1 Tax=Rubrobacter marinus TaxID=2653852 RepID=A0A6G8Q0B6_9ACTN|nr:alpha/beta hydrolase [Rubrobacter marinus]QIN79911.1 alpha/beta fold hydrolase [Rubrobacter marinus]